MTFRKWPRSHRGLLYPYWETQILHCQQSHISPAIRLRRFDNEEAKMIEDLKARLHFLQAIQKLDTERVEPLQSI